MEDLLRNSGIAASAIEEPRPEVACLDGFQLLIHINGAVKLCLQDVFNGVLPLLGVSLSAVQALNACQYKRHTASLRILMVCMNW